MCVCVCVCVCLREMVKVSEMDLGGGGRITCYKISLYHLPLTLCECVCVCAYVCVSFTPLFCAPYVSFYFLFSCALHLTKAEATLVLKIF